MSAAMSLVAVLLLTQVGELFASENTADYELRPLSTRNSLFFQKIIVYNEDPKTHFPHRNGTRLGYRKKESHRKALGPVDEYFDQFAESVIFVNIMKTNLETTIKDVENSTHKLPFKILQQQVLQMKYGLVDLLSTFQSYKLEFSRLYDKTFDFYMLGTMADVLSEDHFENIASFGMYSDIFYHVLRFKALRDLYAVNVRETTDASWPVDLGDIPPDGIAGELSTNVMASLGNVLSVSKYVELIFSSELPIHNGPEWDNAYPGTVYKLMTSTKYYIKSLISYKLVSTTNAIKNSKVELSGNVVKILSTLAKQRILNTIVHKTILRIFSRLKDVESFMKTGESRDLPINTRYFEPIVENSKSDKKRPELSRPDIGIGHMPPSSDSDLSTVNHKETHVSKRFSEDPERSLTLSVYDLLRSLYQESDIRKLNFPLQSSDASFEDTGSILDTTLKWKLLNGKVERHLFKTSIILKTPYGLRVIGRDYPKHGRSILEIQNELKQVSKVIGHDISTYLGKIIAKHFIIETFGYAASGVNDWVRFINSGNLSGGNALIDQIGEYYSSLVVENSISHILNSFGLVGKFSIDKNAVRAKIKASMPFAFEEILKYLKTLNENTSRTFVRFKNLMSILEVVKIKLAMEYRKISNDVISMCGRPADHEKNFYLNFLEYRKYNTKLNETLSKFLFSHILSMFKDGNLWLEDFYSSESVSVVTPELYTLMRKSNVSQLMYSEISDTLLDLKIMDLFLDKCYFNFIYVICDNIPEMYVARLPQILLDLITGFIEAQILPGMCKEYDYREKNSQKQL